MHLAVRLTIFHLILLPILSEKAFALAWVTSPDPSSGWPEVLNELLPQARSVHFATGQQEVVHEVRFENRETFQKFWPIILKLKAKGAPLTLYSTALVTHKNQILTHNKPLVRLRVPSGGIAGIPSPDGTISRVSASKPWPKSALLPSGALPSFVQLEHLNGKATWVPANRERRGIQHRARIDVELVVDGSVIDLNRTRFPEGSIIVDKRELPDAD